MKQIMVLDDGETFSGLDGCRIVSVPDEWTFEDTEEALEVLSGEQNETLRPTDEAEMNRLLALECPSEDDADRLTVLYYAERARVVTVFQDPA